VGVFVTFVTVSKCFVCRASRVLVRKSLAVLEQPTVF
jgi:hypothetical protein